MMLENPSIRQLLESSGEVHLTAYIQSGHGTQALRKQILKILSVASKQLKTVMDADEILRFLEPIRALHKDTRLLPNLSWAIGIFRTADSLRVMSLPIEVDNMTSIATTFHVKPLLRSMQINKEFLIIGLDHQAAHLYRGSSNKLQTIDTVLYPTSLQKLNLNHDSLTFSERLGASLKTSETMDWLSDWLCDSLPSTQVPVFIAGPKHLSEALHQKLSARDVHCIHSMTEFSSENVNPALNKARIYIRKAAKQLISDSLNEYKNAENLELTSNNIFQIAKAAAQGRIQKLIVSAEVQIFGKFNSKTGTLSIHEMDLDHEDDDILDDISQTVIAHGGEVVVAQFDETRVLHPALAILNRKENSKEDFVFQQKKQTLTPIKEAV